MMATFNLNKPPKRKIPKGRVERTHHWIMDFPRDLRYGKIGKPYQSFFDSWLSDCADRMYKYWKEAWWYNEVQVEFEIMTHCLN